MELRLVFSKFQGNIQGHHTHHMQPRMYITGHRRREPWAAGGQVLRAATAEVKAAWRWQPWPCLMEGDTAGCTGWALSAGVPKRRAFYITAQHTTPHAKQGKKWPDLGRRECSGGNQGRVRGVAGAPGAISGGRAGVLWSTACSLPPRTARHSCSQEFTRQTPRHSFLPCRLLFSCSYKNSLTIILFFSICESDDIRVV